VDEAPQRTEDDLNRTLTWSLVAPVVFTLAALALLLITIGAPSEMS
jgi:hypothetical protein